MRMELDINNLFNEVKQIVAECIEKSDKKIVSGNIDFSDMIKEVQVDANKIARKIITNQLVKIEKKIKHSHEREKEYYIERLDMQKTIMTSIGEISFSRNYYKHKKTKEYVFLLDEFLNIKKYERIDKGLKGDMLRMASLISFDNTCKVLTDNKVSRQTVFNIVNDIGSINNLELKTQKKKVVDTIYIEADEDHVPVQNKCSKRKRPKEMKLVYVYEGKKELSSGRKELINPRFFSGNMNPEEIWTEVLDYIYAAYDFHKINRIIIAGDGARWIKKGIEIIPGSIYVLDKFHLQKYLLKIIRPYENIFKDSGVNLRIEINKCIKENNKTKCMNLINSVINELKDIPGINLKSLQSAKRYISNQWEGIINLYKYDYHCCTEGHISNVLSARLSSRPMAWSVSGMDKMARMRVYQASGGDLKELYEEKMRNSFDKIPAIREEIRQTA